MGYNSWHQTTILKFFGLAGTHIKSFIQNRSFKGSKVMMSEKKANKHLASIRFWLPWALKSKQAQM